MKIRNVLRIALVAIRRNAVRSGLTMLGVIIGVASVIAMIALGSGARAAIDDQIQQQGTNVIYVSAGSFGRGPGVARGGAGSVTTLTLEDAQTIARDIPLIARMSPMARGRAQVVAGNQNWNTSVESRAATRTTSSSATGRSPPATTSPPATSSSRRRWPSWGRRWPRRSSPIPTPWARSSGSRTCPSA